MCGVHVYDRSSATIDTFIQQNSYGTAPASRTHARADGSLRARAPPSAVCREPKPKVKPKPPAPGVNHAESTSHYATCGCGSVCAAQRE